MKLNFNDIKAVFIDLDGTLLDEKNGNISSLNLKALNFLQKKANVIISTGRMGANLNKYLKLTKVEYAVACNGAQIINARTNGIIWSKTLNAKSTQLVIDFAKKHKLSLKLNDEKVAYNVTGFISKIISKFLGYKTATVNHLKLKEVFKIVLWGRSKSQIKKLAQEMKESFTITSVVTSSRNYTIEVTNKAATKGLGNRFVWQNLLKIKDINQTLHIGDSMNDSTVIGEVGLLIAMKNSPRALIKLANYLGPHYKKSGLSKIIKGYDLKPLKKPYIDN